MTKCFNPFKKTYSWPIFSIVWPKNFPKNLGILHTTSSGFLALHQNVEKVIDPTPRKHLEMWKD